MDEEPPKAEPSETPPGEGGTGRAARRHRLALLVGAALLVLVVALVARLVAKGGAPAQARRGAPPPVPVSTATAHRGDIGVYLDAIGTVTPLYTVSVTSQVNGPVLGVHFKEGDPVHRGDPLLEIDPRPYRATLLQSQGALQRDENLLEQARINLKRYRAALARNAIAEQIVSDQEKLVAQDEGLVKNDRGVVQFNELQVEYCNITSPIDGRVGLRLVDPGNVVQSAAAVTLAVITQVHPITVVFTIAQDSLGPVRARLREGATLPVDVLDRSAGKTLATGKLLAIDNIIDTTTGTVKARALFDNGDDALFPNQFVNTRLLVDTLQNVTLVPASTIQRNGKTSFVYRIEGETAHIREVTAGVTNAGSTQVDGIGPGDLVANSSFERLQDGAKVSMVSGQQREQQGTGSGRQ